MWPYCMTELVSSSLVKQKVLCIICTKYCFFKVWLYLTAQLKWQVVNTSSQPRGYKSLQIWSWALHHCTIASVLTINPSLAEIIFVTWFLFHRNILLILNWDICHWNISVICLTVVFELAIKVLFSQCFQTFWPKWLETFLSMNKK